MTPLAQEYHFQKEHSGYVVGERAKGALAAARAYLATKADPSSRFRWVEDDSPDLSWMTPEELSHPHEVFGCILERRCDNCGAWETKASLWGIVDPDDNYKRVTEAELALEAK